MTNFEVPSTWLPLADAILKASIVLLAAAVATHTLRRASAALRHLIWTIALLSALLMPALTLAVPRWEVPLISTAVSPAALVADDVPPAPALNRGGHRTTTATTAATGPMASAPGTALSSWSPRNLLAAITLEQAIFAIWVLGALAIVARVLIGVLAVQWMSRRGHRVLDAPWMKMAVQLATEVGVSSNITFLRSRRAAMPMACGVLRPAVLMPEEADEWPADRLRIVLLHELAHVKRHDCLTHLVAQVACALHWFNPLAWIAARQIRTERERACDDLVLAAGTHGPDYADQLLEIARVMRAGRYPAVLAGATLAMAHRSQLEGRLMAILDPRVPHSSLGRLRATAASTVCCAAVVPLAALQPWVDSSLKEPVVTVAASAPRVEIQTPAAQTPGPKPAAEPSPESRRPRESRHDADVDVPTIVSDAITSSVAVAGSAAAAAVHDVLGEVFEGKHADKEQEKSTASSSKADPRMVAALTAALKDTDKEVRETAMHALVQLRDPSVFEPLLQALKDASYEVRQQAAFGLGQLRDKRAVDPLSAALKDEHPDVREQAAFALGQLRDRGAIAALTAALKDVDADVREQVIFALGQMRDPATIEGLTLALRDANADVREQAAFALGQIRDKRAVTPLISALKDSNADVREQAAFALGQIRDGAAVEPLVIALKDSAADVREQAAFALGQLRDPRAIDGLTVALKDPQASVRQQAAFALGQLAR
jgi:HEAT repeat protein/beta-lactamase regulating signal transducer with metallopeptidase domain